MNTEMRPQHPNNQAIVGVGKSSEYEKEKENTQKASFKGWMVYSLQKLGKLPVIRHLRDTSSTIYHTAKWTPTFFSEWKKRVTEHSTTHHIVALALGVAPWLLMTCVADPILAWEKTRYMANQREAGTSAGKPSSKPSSEPPSVDLRQGIHPEAQELLENCTAESVYRVHVSYEEDTDEGSIKPPSYASATNTARRQKSLSADSRRDSISDNDYVEIEAPHENGLNGKKT